MKNIPLQMPIDDKLIQKLKTVAKEGETLEDTASRLVQEWSDKQDAEIRKKAKHYRVRLI